MRVAPLGRARGVASAVLCVLQQALFLASTCDAATIPQAASVFSCRARLTGEPLLSKLPLLAHALHVACLV